jgi:hypothetical protein
MDKARPTFEDETPVNVFDPFEGADFKLRMRKVDGYPNYDQSTFVEPSPISKDEEKILEVVNSQYKLSKFLERDNFKTYEELARKLTSVLDPGSANIPSAASLSEDDEPSVQTKTTAKSKVTISSDNDEEALSYFKKIAEEE